MVKGTDNAVKGREARVLVNPSPGADVGAVSPSPGAEVGRGEPSPSRCAALAGVCPSPGANVAGVRPVPVQLCEGRAKSQCSFRKCEPLSRCKCGRNEPGPGTDVGGPGASPVPVQMWRGPAQSRCTSTLPFLRYARRKNARAHWCTCCMLVLYVARGTCSACGFAATCPRSVDIVVLMFVAAAVSLLGMLVTQVAQAPAQVWQG